MGLFDGWNAGDIALTVGTGGTYGLANAAYKAAGNNDSLTDVAGKGLKSFADARKSNFNAHPWYDNPNYDPNAYNFGGFNGGANYYSQQAFDEQGREQSIDDYYRQMAEEAQGRQITGDPALDAQAAASRGEQANATDLARQAAEGKAPSAAQYQLQNAFNEAAANQGALAGGARGAAGIALAQGNANANVANLNAQAANASGQLRANEMANARGLYGSLSSGQRGMDIQAQQNQFQNQLANRNANDQYGLGLGQLAGQRSQTAQGYYNTGIGVQQNQAQAKQNQQQLLAGNDQAAQGANQQTNFFNTNSDKELQQQAIGMFGSSAASGLMGGGK